MRGVLLLPWLLAAAGGAAGCASSPEPFDYTAFRAHMPRSILVLPPLNESPEVSAGPAFASTVTRPLAERGYYVFPVAVVEAYMRDQGLPSAGEMHEVPPAKLGEVFGADAVLYLTVTTWGNSYRVVSSTAEAGVRARLVDAATGTLLWEGEAYGAAGSGDGGGNPVAMLVTALVTQVVSSSDDRSRGVARGIAGSLFASPGRGLLHGPRSPRFGEDAKP